MQRASIMIVGDRSFCASLSDDVRAGTGLAVAAVTSNDAARSLLRSGMSDIVLAVLDTSLEDGGAFALCGELAAAAQSPPVMMVGREDNEAEALRSLEAGAIDYFARSHHRAELLARLRAHLRSQSTSIDVEITVGPFTFRPGQRSLTDRQTRARIWLTAKEARLLRRLHQAQGKPVPAAALIGAAWNSANTSMHTLHTHVYRLRTKLGAGKGNGPVLQTTRDGYALQF